MRACLPFSVAFAEMTQDGREKALSDGGKGANDMIEHIDSEEHLCGNTPEKRHKWGMDRLHRLMPSASTETLEKILDDALLVQATEKVRRQMPWCLETFAQIIENGSEREKSIMNMALTIYRQRGKRQKVATITTGGSSCGSSACPNLSASPGIQG